MATDFLVAQLHGQMMKLKYPSCLVDQVALVTERVSLEDEKTGDAAMTDDNCDTVHLPVWE